MLTTFVREFSIKTTQSFLRTCIIDISMFSKGPSGSAVQRPIVLFSEENAQFHLVSRSVRITYDCSSADEKWEEFLGFVEILTSCSERKKKWLLQLQTNMNSVSSCIHPQKVKSCWHSSVFNHWIFYVTKWS